ncbi:DegT/DnrJ/EryC1/StrS family aminotransferase [Tabrizicola sp.]|uniref:DegT/DnrJ/EryC1/StrS family aminotransferase n=1 Tax=Tabrizicola sp. TaxID=2005166 RepID=UPI003F3A620A
MTRYQPEPPLKQLFVARPTLPSVEEYEELLATIWSRKILTNRGPLLQEFEREIATYLGVEHVSVVANATLGLMVALMEIGATEVITTPFSFVATANAIRLVGAKPVFADIDPFTLALDPADVERRITSRTNAILGVHCYGLPGNLAALEEVGARHGIPVIYDAAHAFGVRRGGQSILRSGLMSVLSFHATKVFHSAEGGAIVCRDAETKRRIDILCNHGISDETTADVVGINAKMSEFHAALGLVQLRHLKAEVAARDRVGQRYASGLAMVKGIRPICPAGDPDHNNYAYPVFVEPDYPLSRDELYDHLRQKGIVARRYFYPLIPHLGAFRDPAQEAPERFPVAELAAERVLCLPMYGDLDDDDQTRVIDAIAQVTR